jgi:hypothetical protein
MPLTQLRRDFAQLKKVRRLNPAANLQLLGQFARDALVVLTNECETEEITWRGGGEKRYRVFTADPARLRFSRVINQDLFIPSAEEFTQRWHNFVQLVLGNAGRETVAGIATSELDRLFYTAVIAYASAVEIFQPGDRGGPGTYFEMLVGPTIAVLTGRAETGAVILPVPDTNEVEKIPTDLTFAARSQGITLVVPTKISTRERISQAYVHQLILEAARPGQYRSILCIANENNVMFPVGVSAQEKTTSVAFARDTLVPGTIVLYQRYVSQLSGLYYLDPPDEYLSGRYKGFPPVKRFGHLLTQDLPSLLASNR